MGEFQEDVISISRGSLRAPMGHRELPENVILVFRVSHRAQMGHRELGVRFEGWVLGFGFRVRF